MLTFIILFQLLRLMSRKKIEEIPSKIISRSSQHVLRKTLLNSKFKWLVKYIGKEDQENITEQNYLSKSIKIHPKQKGKLVKKEPLGQRRDFNNQPLDATSHLRRYQTRDTTKIFNRHMKLVTEPTQRHGKNGKNSSLLLHNINPRNTLNFSYRDTRKICSSKNKSELSYKRKANIWKDGYKQDQFLLSPWDLHNESVDNKQNLFAAIE